MRYMLAHVVGECIFCEVGLVLLHALMQFDRIAVLAYNVSRVERFNEFEEMYVRREKWRWFLMMISLRMDTLTIPITPGSSIPVEFCVHCNRWEWAGMFQTLVVMCIISFNILLISPLV